MAIISTRAEQVRRPTGDPSGRYMGAKWDEPDYSQSIGLIDFCKNIVRGFTKIPPQKNRKKIQDPPTPPRTK